MFRESTATNKHKQAITPTAVARFVGIGQNTGSLDLNAVDGGLHAAVPKIRARHRAETGRNARCRRNLQARQGRQDAKCPKAVRGGAPSCAVPAWAAPGAPKARRRKLS